MDKYEYNLKLEEIDKLVDQGDYEEAAHLADTIDWRRVRNIRTLCLISEIYEASGRLEDSKSLLVRAYRRSPVGRTVLYRLVEVTTALQQYDEAIEYYTEYVQAAPHDNNRYILKYKIYKGRGSSIEELIAILEEYLGQEYTERWAYELATLYQQSGQMQKCLAACDDLVLWFHSGKYVAKALELKKRYAALTPKQQQIYEECVQEKMDDYLDDDEEEDNVIQNVESTDGEVIAESIMAETEREIANQVAAHKAELEKEAAAQPEPEIQQTRIFGGVRKEAQHGAASPESDAGKKGVPGAAGQQNASAVHEEPGQTRVMPGAAGQQSAPAVHEELGQTRVMPGAAGQQGTAVPDAAGQAGLQSAEMAGQTDRQSAGVTGMAGQPGVGIAGTAGQAAPQSAGTGVSQGAASPAADAVPEDPRDLQVELAKSMRKIISGVVKRTEENEDDIPATIDAGVPKIQKIEMPQMQEPVAGQLSIDDILLSMSDKGKRVTDAVLGAEEQAAEAAPGNQPEAGGSAPAAERRSAQPEMEEQPFEVETVVVPRTGKSVTEAAAETLTAAQREALQYTNHPEKLLKNRRSLPTYEEPQEDDDLGKTRRIVNTKEELKEAAEKEILAEKTIRIPTEEIARRMQEAAGRADGQDSGETAGQAGAYDMDAAGQPQESSAEGFDGTGASADGVYAENNAEGYPSGDAYAESGAGASADDVYAADGAEGYPADGAYAEGGAGASADGAYEEDGATGYAEEGEPYDDGEYLTIPPHLRNLFSGFTEIEGLEDQIANAIIQAEAKGDDRTSRSGNILIFGAHGSGKTTLAMNIAKAIAQDKGTQVMKMAKIYAADLNRKDIAATVAKIAGGTLIIEEAGDLEPGTVEQLTTAMEFRTDGLVVILEDEQQYIHELLMRHPRFTMKFTAQIYIPAYTVEELAMFGQIYANAQDYVIGEEAQETLCQKLSDAIENGAAGAITDVIEIVGKAIARSNKFFRKVSMGKKRYDENDYIILFPKDFK